MHPDLSSVLERIIICQYYLIAKCYLIPICHHEDLLLLFSLSWFFTHLGCSTEQYLPTLVHTSCHLHWSYNAMSKIGAVLIHHHILIESSWAFLSPILVIKVQVQIWFWYSGIVPIEALVIVLTVFYDKTVITSSPSVIQTWIFKLMLIIWYAIPNHYFPCSSHGN